MVTLWVYKVVNQPVIKAHGENFDENAIVFHENTFSIRNNSLAFQISDLRCNLYALLQLQTGRE